jgi:hypothetical protein
MHGIIRVEEVSQCTAHTQDARRLTGCAMADMRVAMLNTIGEEWYEQILACIIQRC